ncbi:coenzyme F420-0:L-glutamate ligase [Patescibacteria group bacterium]|nr:coenzyme F420-0:L-glutamate ligase [Patescibacteria group bacterium]
MGSYTVRAIGTLPLINPGDDLPALLIRAVESSGSFEDSDVLVLAQKIVSKAEGAVVDLQTITASAEALQLAAQTGRDPRLVQVYLDEAKEVLAVKGRMIITRHKLGFVGSSSGVDRSNIAPHEAGRVVLLPRDPDNSARVVRARVLEHTGKTIAVIINDSCGRDYRDGSVGMAIGIAGIGAIETAEKVDLFGNVSHPRIALVDEIAAAASILMGQAGEGVPAVLVRGLTFTVSEKARITDLL